MRIEYSTNCGSDWQYVALSTSDDDTYTWTIPSVSSNDCLVRICDVSDPTCCDTSDSCFQICECLLVEMTAENLQKGIDGCPYSQIFNVVGGCAPYMWSIPSGHLPNGLSLDNSSGAISGQPSEVGLFEFTIIVNDGLGKTIKRNSRYRFLTLSTPKVMRILIVRLISWMLSKLSA